MSEQFRSGQRRTGAELAERHSCGKPDVPRQRTSASFDTLAERIRQVAAARRAHDVFACRRELEALSAEAALLAEMDSLPV